MASLREQVLLRALAVLQAAATGALLVARSREVSLTRSTSPAIVLMPEVNDLGREATSADRNQFVFAVEIFVRGDTWDSLADPIDVIAHAALMSDAQLAGLAILRRVSEAFESQEADRTAGTLTVRYRAIFLTRANAIDQAA